MKKTVDYSRNRLQMGDLLKSMNVSIKDDFSDIEHKKLKKYLENYMTNGSCNLIQMDLKKFYLVLQGSDEVSYLYQYF